jgi:hypothetical protein
MRAVDQQWIRKSIAEEMARANDGKVRLSRVLRLFSDYGTDHELRNLMDEFVHEGRAERVLDAGDTTYVFTAVARGVGESLTKEIDKLERQLEEIRKRVLHADAGVKMLDDLQTSWNSSWNQVISDPRQRAVVVNYNASFLREEKTRLLDAISIETANLSNMEGRMTLLKNRIDASFSE